MIDADLFPDRHTSAGNAAAGDDLSQNSFHAPETLELSLKTWPLPMPARHHQTNYLQKFPL